MGLDAILLYGLSSCSSSAITEATDADAAAASSAEVLPAVDAKALSGFCFFWAAAAIPSAASI